MRLRPILLLCLHCLLSSATIIDADCNDQNVFGAVDEALRFFNDAKEDGNQFILYRITDAKIKNEEDGQIHHFVEYETHESSCEVKSGKSWQECLPNYTHQAKCSAHVLFNKDLKLRNVESQNCSSPKAIEWPPVIADHRPCLGCPQPIDKQNKELLCFVHSTIEQVNTDANHQFYFDLESIVNATRQVVFGWKYHIQFLIRQTNCSKSDYTSKNPKECKIEKEGESFQCTTEVHVTPDGKANYLLLECKSDTGVCINCPVVVHPWDSELQTLLVQVIDEYNLNSNHTELYNVAFVEKAVKKGFQRVLYEVTFIIGPTNCSKNEYSILGDECDFTTPSARLSCKTKISVTDKKMNVHSAPDCEKAFLVFSARFGGLNPFRISRHVNYEENNRDGMLKFLKPVKRTAHPRRRRHGHNNNNGHKHGKKGKKDKEEKNKHKHQHDDSSEEDNANEVTQAPLQITKPTIQRPGNVPAIEHAHEVSDNQEIILNTEETSVLDLLPTDVIPRCPGRVWQPKSPVSSIPTVQAFTNDYLVFAIGDLTPTSGQDIKKNGALTPKQISFFNDKDLLD